MYKDKKIFVLGMARSGYEVAKLLVNEAKEIVVVDETPDDDHALELANLGVKVITSDRSEQANYLDDSFDLVVKNPGVLLTVPTIIKAEDLNIPVTNEVDVAFNMLPSDIKIVAITGANGKTTTTTLIYEILKQAKSPAILGGNIGIPISKLVSEVKAGDILVLEISIQQLTNMKDFKSNISVLTNLSPSHLDHVGTYENYQDYKKRIFNHHTSEDVAIINAGDENVLKICSNIPSRKISFSATVAADLYMKDDAIYYENEEIIKLVDIKLVGEHNYENIMSAIAAAKEFGVSNADINAVLGTFTGVKHRIDFVDEINGVKFYNDSKATNNVATITALKSFDKDLILILGGLDRGQTFDELTPYMNAVKKVVCYGETKQKIAEYVEKIDTQCQVFENLTEATKAAFSDSIAGDTILLSPACASWDQYKNFEIRGDEFIDIVGHIKQQNDLTKE